MNNITVKSPYSCPQLTENQQPIKMFFELRIEEVKLKTAAENKEAKKLSLWEKIVDVIILLIPAMFPQRASYVPPPPESCIYQIINVYNNQQSLIDNNHQIDIGKIKQNTINELHALKTDENIDDHKHIDAEIKHFKSIDYLQANS